MELRRVLISFLSEHINLVSISDVRSDKAVIAVMLGLNRNLIAFSVALSY